MHSGVAALRVKRTTLTLFRLAPPRAVLGILSLANTGATVEGHLQNAKPGSTRLCRQLSLGSSASPLTRVAPPPRRGRTPAADPDKASKGTAVDAPRNKGWPRRPGRRASRSSRRSLRPRIINSSRPHWSNGSAHSRTAAAASLHRRGQRTALQGSTNSRMESGWQRLSCRCECRFRPTSARASQDTAVTAESVVLRGDECHSRPCLPLSSQRPGLLLLPCQRERWHFRPQRPLGQLDPALQLPQEALPAHLSLP